MSPLDLTRASQMAAFPCFFLSNRVETWKDKLTTLTQRIETPKLFTLIAFFERWKCIFNSFQDGHCLWTLNHIIILWGPLFFISLILIHELNFIRRYPSDLMADTQLPLPRGIFHVLSFIILMKTDEIRRNIPTRRCLGKPKGYN